MSNPKWVGWCPECGPVSTYDADGLCKTCGSSACGPGADAALCMKAVHEAEMGVCEQHCEVVAELKSTLHNAQQALFAEGIIKGQLEDALAALKRVHTSLGAYMDFAPRGLEERAYDPGAAIQLSFSVLKEHGRR